MKWYIILLIVLSGLLVLAAITFTIIYFSSKSSKEKQTKKAKSFYLSIIDVFGGKENIEDVYHNSSRLTLVLKDSSFINEKSLNFMKENGIGVVKSSKKITLVIGEMALIYKQGILKEMGK